MPEVQINMWVILLSVLTFFSTFLGGLFALRFKNQLSGIMAFAAGVLLGVVGFDIFPEIIEQIRTHNFKTAPIMISLVLGFLIFHVLEKTILIHCAHEHDYAEHKHPHVGVLSALALAGHSFMDGVGIGLGFQVSASIGIIVAIAVIAHDFTDGMNTVVFMITNHNSDKRSKRFLLLDAVAPILGAASTLFIRISPHFLVLYLGFFAGFLLYIGASDILPEAHSKRSSYKLIALTVLGAAFAFAAVTFI